MNRSALIASGLMFSVPFVLLGVCYAALPSELPVLRIPMGHAVTLATKSAFTVFRVPLMNLTHGLMAAVMLSRARDFENAERRVSYASMFATLLFTVALKSDFEAMEISSLATPTALGSYARWLAAGTGLSVVAGLSLALMRGRRVPIPWPELRLRIRDKIALAGLFALYVGLVIASSRASHPA
jgi:hypothetical protein